MRFSRLSESRQYEVLEDDLTELSSHLDQLILATPTGEKRNTLTEMNLLRMQINDRLELLKAQT